MGGELGIVYAISKLPLNADWSGLYIQESDVKFYEETLHSDEEAEPLPCTSRAVIYCVLMIAALVSRAFKGLVTGEGFQRETVMDLKHMVMMERK